MGHFGNGMPISLSSSHFTYFFKGDWPSFIVSIYYPPTFLECWVLIAPPFVILFSKMIILFFLMWWCMLRMTFFPSSWHYKIFKLSYIRLFILRPTLWKSCGIIISSFACIFMNYLHRQDFATLLVDVPLDTMQTCFRFYTCPIVVTWLLICPTKPMFCLSLVHFFTTLHTCLGLPHPIIAHFFMLLLWTYHWSFWYPLASVPVWEWMHCNPQYYLGYHCNYLFHKVEHTYRKRFPTFSFTTLISELIFLSPT